MKRPAKRRRKRPAAKAEPISPRVQHRLTDIEYVQKLLAGRIARHEELLMDPRSLLGAPPYDIKNERAANDSLRGENERLRRLIECMEKKLWERE